MTRRTPRNIGSVTPAEMMIDAARQRDEMMRQDPRDEKWAEWFVNPETYEALGPFKPPVPAGLWTSSGSSPETFLFGYPVRVTASAAPGRFHLSHETRLDATIRHQAAAGRTVNVVKSPPSAYLTMPPPTARALARHWIDKVRNR